MPIYKIYCRIYQRIMQCMAVFLDWSEPSLLKGPGSINDLPKLIQSHGYKRVLVVTDQGLMKIGLPNRLLQALEAAGISAVVYDRTHANPTIQNIEEARKLYLEHGCEAILAFGGGSPLDCAKAVGARIARPKKSVAQMRGLFKVGKKIPMLYAIPTTAGTGSETTLVAVASDPDTHEKYAISDPKLRPLFAVLDPELTLGLPPHITAATGMDALTHAIEAYIGRSNTKKTAAKALGAAQLIFKSLETAYQDGKNLEAREDMLQASYDAGVAFTRAYVGYIHSIAHALGGLYDLPHGLANAVILPHVLAFYGKAAHKRLARLADAAGISRAGQSDAEKADAIIAAIRGMNERMGIPAGFTCIAENDIPVIVSHALKEANPFYPVPKIMDYDACVKIIQGLMLR